jgi:hypothetical protein
MVGAGRSLAGGIASHALGHQFIDDIRAGSKADMSG